MSAPDGREWKALREENQRRKKLLAESLLDNAALKEVVARKW